MSTRTLGLVIAALLVVVIGSVVAAVGGSSSGLKAEVYVENADIGIPGITKMYGARLVNRSGWPIRVHYCDYVDDALSHGKTLAYAVERWNAVSQQWTTIVQANGSHFCEPYPLGMIKTKLTSG